MIIGVDRAQQAGKHDLKHMMLKDRGIRLLSLPLPVGDYVNVSDEMIDVIKRRRDKLKKMDLIGLVTASVDTKRSISELYANLITHHDRFSDECNLAKNNGIQLYIVTENTEGIETEEDLPQWQNESAWNTWRKKQKNGIKCKPPATPTTLRKIMCTMTEKYGVEFLFCHPEETAEIIESLLSEE